jgi:glycosyltransferase involved in cell wall biosynthesis
MKTFPITLSVFFPTFNEEDNITSLVHEADHVLKSLVQQYEIIIVDDGSTDRTAEIADTMATENEHIRVVHHKRNRGYGAAVWSGIRAARYDYVFFTDADLQFKLTEIKKLLAYIPSHDVVIGYRAKRRDPFMRLVNASGWNVLNKVLFNLNVKDIDCAFKLFKRTLVQELPIQSQGAMFSAELLIRLSRQGVRFKEVPVTHLPRLKGSPTGARPAVIVRAFKEMLRVYQGDLGDGRYIALAKYLALGASNTLIDWLCYFILIRTGSWFGNHEVVAKAVAFSVGSIPVLVAGTHWVFPKPNRLQGFDLIKLYTILGLAFVINVSTLASLIDYGVSDFTAVIIATGASFAWNLSLAWFMIIKDKMFIPAFNSQMS